MAEKQWLVVGRNPSEKSMNFRQKITLSLLLTIVLGSIAFAQVVHIPDPNLRAAIADALDIPRGAPITQEDMTRLTYLNVRNQGITELTGLESATNLITLRISHNPITNLSPIASLTHLERLTMWGLPEADITQLANLTNLKTLDIAACDLVDISPLAQLVNLTDLNARHNDISDLTPLANLTNLVVLLLSRNNITDVTPLANLTNLAKLWLDINRIIDVSPLAGLTHLELLEIQNNRITDHSLLDMLALSHFVYDQTCDMPPLPLKPRLENRTYPSIFMRWSGGPITNRPGLSVAENLAHHDLRWGGSQFGLQFVESQNAFKRTGNIVKALHTRDELIAINPHMVFLVDIRMRSAPLNWYPKNWPHWIRDENGKIARGVTQDGVVSNRGLMDFTHPAVQEIIVQKAIAASKCGLYDGIFFDFWSESWRVIRIWDGTRNRYFRTLEEELEARDIIVRRIRASTRPDFLIIGNTNDRIIPRTAPYINGGFMEMAMPASLSGVQLETHLSRVENSLLWLDQNLREPRVNCLESYSVPTASPDSPKNLRWMRGMTTLSLTHSDGYVLFQPGEEEGHYWYDFWDADLGRPIGAKARLYDEDISGLYIREFTNGWAVYNHSGSEQEITLPELAVGVESRLEGISHTLPNLDGEMYLRARPANPADVNEDGVVNILDLILVAQAIGAEKSEPDVNGDGVINMFDLVMVAGAIGGGGAAPSAYSPDPSIISAADVERWLAQVQGSGVSDANFQRGIRFLEGLLAALTPKETTLLPNYPNPFNPETWIPYRLARESEVAITIYDTKGTPVRRLALGNQAAGYYAERGKAAYWDGRNERGETVASGIYVYHFQAGDYAASRRMVIVK